MLHLVAFSPARADLRDQFLRVVQPGDTLFLLEDGCLFAATGDHVKALSEQLPAGCTLEVLGDDLAARGLSVADSAVRQTDHAGLVRASERHGASMSWWPS